jgi:anti-anti-sigma regulatory factor
MAKRGAQEIINLQSIRSKNSVFFKLDVLLDLTGIESMTSSIAMELSRSKLSRDSGEALFVTSNSPQPNHDCHA